MRILCKKVESKKNYECNSEGAVPQTAYQPKHPLINILFFKYIEKKVGFFFFLPLRGTNPAGKFIFTLDNFYYYFLFNIKM